MTWILEWQRPWTDSFRCRPWFFTACVEFFRSPAILKKLNADKPQSLYPNAFFCIKKAIEMRLFLAIQPKAKDLSTADSSKQ